MDDFPILQFGSFRGPVPLTISVCQVAREKQRGYDVLLCGDLVEIFDETKSFDLVVAADVFELWQGLTDWPGKKVMRCHEDSKPEIE